MPDKRFQLLSYLAYEGDWVAREQASFLFWPDVPSQSARTNLRHLLKRVRHFEWLADLEADRHRLRWAVTTDVAALKVALASDDVDSCLSEYRGPLLQDLDGDHVGEFGSWLELERVQVSSLWRGTVLKGARQLTEAGRYEDAAGLYQRLLVEDELDEEALVGYLKAASKAGDREQALSRYRSFADRLKSELDLEPSSATEQLADSVRVVRPTPEEAESLPQIPGSEKLPELPLSPTTFIGRELELSEIAELFAKSDCRLLTVTGPGGVGKTRLVLKAAERLSSQQFPDGCCWVALESLARPSDITLALADSLGVTLDGAWDAREQISHALKPRELLLVLDNFEHLMAGTPLVTHLIQRCPQLKVLVTSREALNLEEEWCLPLDGLPLPAEGAISVEEALTFDAVEAFVARAQRVKPDFDVSEENLADVVHICRLVGGLPLGIELAGAWVRMMAPEAIARQIEQSLDFLSARTRNVAGRHKSIRATFEHSWALLTPAEQQAMRNLSVFTGGFSLEAAKYVAGASLPVLANLVDKSLLRVVDNERYDRHPLLHEYTREKLGDQVDDAKNRHLKYYVALAEYAYPTFRSCPESWLPQLEVERENLRVALEHAYASKQPELGLRLAGVVWRYWSARGPFSEGRKHLTQLLTLAARGTATRARAMGLLGAGQLAQQQGDLASARAWFEERLVVSRELGDEQAIGESLFNLGTVISEQGDHDKARALCEESLAILSRSRTGIAVSFPLHRLGLIAYRQGDFAAARSRFEESLSVARRFGYKYGVAVTLSHLGQMAYSQADYSAARTFLEESLEVFREADFKPGIVESLACLGLVACKQGDYAEAQALQKESLELSLTLGDKHSVAGSIEGCARLAAVGGEIERAAWLWGAAEGFREQIGAPLPPSRRIEYAQGLKAARGQMGEAAFKAAWNKGRKMTLQQALAYALEENPPGSLL